MLGGNGNGREICSMKRTLAISHNGYANGRKKMAVEPEKEVKKKWKLEIGETRGGSGERGRGSIGPLM